MEVTEQERTFGGFVTAMVWVCVVVIFVLLFLAVFNS